MPLIPGQFPLIGWDRRRIDNQVGVLRYKRWIIFIVDGDTFRFQLFGQRGGGPVITADLLAMELEISCECTHTYSAYADEINLFYIVQINHSFRSDLISP